ncbi:hypothetical protein, partial [Flavihumibacter sp. CACIAM 22H1]|uniref:hypothetical protein n=1 Tax=Flavihumibacter sp. CACIAM 22H1 TaxID=1812911 RepID=UPI0007A82ACF
LEGAYSGTFKRYHDPVNKTAAIRLVFEKNTWTGTSNLPHYPALHKGNYRITESSSFYVENTAGWTADFDWTLILDGNYILHQVGDSLVFTKSYGNGNVDVYKLKKQPD